MAISTFTSVGYRPNKTEQTIKVRVVAPLLHFIMTASILCNISALVAAIVTAWISEQDQKALYWAAYPLVGCLIGSTMVLLLSVKVERQRVIVGRFIGAMAFGVFIPNALGYFYDWIQKFSENPLNGAGLGFACGMFGYVFVYYLVERLYKEAPDMARKTVRHGRDMVLTTKKPRDE